PLPAASPYNFAQAAPSQATFQSIQPVNKIHETLAMITAIIMMNYDYNGFAQQSIEGKVFDALPRVSTSEERKVAVGHDGSVPDIRNCDCARARVSANDVIIHCGDEIGVFQHTHGSFRKNTLRKYHNSIVADSGNRFMAIHTLERLLGLRVKALP